jgi:hypothetical protein
MLAGLSAAVAVLIGCSMRVAVQLSGADQPRGPSGVTLRAALLPPLALAGAVGPLAVSSRPSVAEVGGGLAMLFLIAALLSILLVPAMARWLNALFGRSSSRLYRR